MAAGEEAMKTCYWLDRTTLICLLYWAVDGDKKDFIPVIVVLIMHDFIVFLAQEVYSLFAQFKLTFFNQSGIDSMNNGCEEESYEHGEEGSKQQVPCESCNMVVEQEATKVKEKYKQKLVEKEEKFKKEKRLLNDKYNEDRERWEEERNLLKKKYEEMRWI